MTKRKDDKETPAKTPDPEPVAASEEPLPVDVGPKPDSTSGTEPAAEPVPAPEQVERDQLKDRLLRLQADFDNFRKRTLRERDEFQKRAGEAVLADLVPVLDHLEYGIQQAMERPGWEAYAEGLRLIETEFREVLRKHGLVEIEALGLEFDPRVHEAIAHMPSPEAPDGTIVSQTRKGYRLGDRLLRASTVVVSSGPGPDSGIEEAEDALKDEEK